MLEFQLETFQIRSNGTANRHVAALRIQTKFRQIAFGTRAVTRALSFDYSDPGDGDSKLLRNIGNYASIF